MKGRDNMIRLENDKLKVDINPHGAEVKRIYHIEHDVDYFMELKSEILGEIFTDYFFQLSDV